jgi:hypothetical protein
MASVTLILTRTPVHEFVYSSRGNVEADTMTDEARARFYRSRTQPLNRPANVIHYSGRWGSLLLLGDREFMASFQLRTTRRLLRQSEPSM